MFVRCFYKTSKQFSISPGIIFLFWYQFNIYDPSPPPPLGIKWSRWNVSFPVAGAGCWCSCSRNQSWNSLQNINIFKFSDPNPISWHRFSVPKHFDWIIGNINKSKSWTKDATFYTSVAKAMLESHSFVHLPESKTSHKSWFQSTWKQCCKHLKYLTFGDILVAKVISL